MRIKLFNKTKSNKGWQGRPFSLDRPLLHFSPYDTWRIRHACEGVAIFGRIGSGKTSGSGRTIAKSFLKAGFGGLVLAMKVDERALWESYCRETGRELIVFSPKEPWRFNFLDYELKRPGSGAGITLNIVNLFVNTMEIGKKGTEQDPYWQRSMKQMLSRAIDLLIAAGRSLTLRALYDLIMSAPRSLDEVKSAAWRGSFCARMLEAAENQPKSPFKQQDFDITAQYWISEFPALAEKTRSVIVNSFTGMADGFLTGTLRELFCTETNLVPEVSHHGGVILLDFPLREFGELGVLAQVLFKYIWQNAAERRSIADNPRPVFLWADEAHEFITPYDRRFQSTARSCRAATVFLSQNINGYYDAVGSEKNVKSLLGNLVTKIFHLNDDDDTNQYAASYFTKTWASNPNVNTQYDNTAPRGEQRYSAGAVRSLQNQVQPHQFTRLRRGTPRDNCRVDAIMGGQIWRATQRNYIKVTFNQNH